MMARKQVLSFKSNLFTTGEQRVHRCLYRLNQLHFLFFKCEWTNSSQPPNEEYWHFSSEDMKPDTHFSRVLAQLFSTLSQNICRQPHWKADVSSDIFSLSDLWAQASAGLSQINSQNNRPITSQNMTVEDLGFLKDILVHHFLMGMIISSNQSVVLKLTCRISLRSSSMSEKNWLRMTKTQEPEVKQNKTIVSS